MENTGALNLEKLRRKYHSPDGQYWILVKENIDYTVANLVVDWDGVESILVWIIADGFNRSMVDLEKAKAIDRTKMKQKYIGVGSEYYDIVTKEMQSCIPIWSEFIGQFKTTGQISNIELTSVL